MNKSIYVTKDYSKFKRVTGNREVDKSRIRKIRKSMEDVGCITNPILVNEKFEIIDGQGRFKALKEMGKPIYYIVEGGIGLKECIALNNGQKNWNTQDFIKTYAKKRIKSYVYLRRLQNEFGIITNIDVFIAALFGKDKLTIKEVADGNLPISEKRYEEARYKLNKIYPTITQNIKKNGLQKIAKGLIYCLDIDNIDMNKMLKDVENVLQKNEVPILGSTNQIMQYLENIYNKNVKGKRLYLFTEYRKNCELRKRK